MKKLRIKLCGA